MLSLLFIGLMGWFTQRLYGPREGLFALLLAALGPATLTGLSIISWGNYVENLILTALAFILTHEIVFRTSRTQVKKRRWLFAGFGLVSGLGWWTHPAILVPLAVCGLFLFLEENLQTV